jgi:cysteine desulfurase / selenocysteine lyase
VAHLDQERAMGGYEAAIEAAPLIASTYDAIATLIGAERDEIALVENATVAWSTAFYALDFSPGDRVITGVAEYASNYLAFLQLAESRGIEIEVCPDDEHGQLDLEALTRMCQRPPKLIAITHVPTNGGLVNPAEAVGRIATQCGALYLLDACQSVGQLPINVDAIRCDFLSVTGRKFLRGPRGTGFLYARRASTHHMHPAVIDLHSSVWTTASSYELAAGAKRFENWESNYAGLIGLGEAVRYAIAVGPDVIEARNLVLAQRLRDGLRSIDAMTVHDKGQRQCAIVTCSHDTVSSVELQRGLRAQAINTSVSLPTSTRLDFEQRQLPELLRLSLHYFNTIDEIDHVVGTVRSLTQAQ